MIAAPLGTFTGWNIRRRGRGEGAMHEFSGSYIPFPETPEERAATADPRRSLSERYGDAEGYVAAVREAAQALVRDGFMLEEDVERAAAFAADWGRADERRARSVNPYAGAAETGSALRPRSTMVLRNSGLSSSRRIEENRSTRVSRKTLGLETGKRGAKAVVDAAAEREVGARTAFDVEPVRVGKGRRRPGWPPRSGARRGRSCAAGSRRPRSPRSPA